MILLCVRVRVCVYVCVQSTNRVDQTVRAVSKSNSNSRVSKSSSADFALDSRYGSWRIRVPEKASTGRNR